MTKSEDIKRAALNKWKEFLRSTIKDETFFPWFYKGAKRDRKANFIDQLKDQEELIRNSKDVIGKGYKLKTETITSKLYGAQTEIEAIYIDTADDFLYIADKKREYSNFKKGVQALSSFWEKEGISIAILKEWELDNLDEMIKDREDDFWTMLLISLKWLLDNPDSNIYIREIPVEVHSKFIENNSKLISSLYSKIKAIDKYTSIENLCGLKTKEPLIRFRVKSANREETALPKSAFDELERHIDTTKLKKAIVIENEIVYLTFPLDDELLIIFGSGFKAIDALKDAKLLDFLKIYYFGDLDEHGFDILSLFRKEHPNTESFLMDIETYNVFSQYAVKGQRENVKDIEKNLNDKELELFRYLKAHSDKNRLEQERITQAYIIENIEKLKS